MNLKRMLRERRVIKSRASAVVSEVLQELEFKSQKKLDINEWVVCMDWAGKDYDKIMACGPPPDGTREYVESSKQREYLRFQTSVDIYELAQDWPKWREALLKDLEDADPMKSLRLIEMMAHGLTFPLYPPAEFIFGQGADLAFFQDKYDRKVQEIVSRICEAPREDAERLFHTFYRYVTRKMEADSLGEVYLAKRVDRQSRSLFALRLPEEWYDLVAFFRP